MTAGTLIAAVAVPIEKDSLYYTVFAILLSLLVFLGFTSLLKLVKLRLAWRGSVEAMCEIKEYYTKTFNNIKLEEAFLWKKEFIPFMGKKWTVAFLMALTIGSISAASASGAVLFWGLATSDNIYVIWSILVGLVIFATQILIWHFICHYYDIKNTGQPLS